MSVGKKSDELKKCKQWKNGKMEKYKSTKRTLLSHEMFRKKEYLAVRRKMLLLFIVPCWRRAE